MPALLVSASCCDLSRTWTAQEQIKHAVRRELERSFRLGTYRHDLAGYTVDHVRLSLREGGVRIRCAVLQAKGRKSQLSYQNLSTFAHVVLMRVGYKASGTIASTHGQHVVECLTLLLPTLMACWTDETRYISASLIFFLTLLAVLMSLWPLDTKASTRRVGWMEVAKSMHSHPKSCVLWRRPTKQEKHKLPLLYINCTTVELQNPNQQPCYSCAAISQFSVRASQCTPALRSSQSIFDPSPGDWQRQRRSVQA